MKRPVVDTIATSTSLAAGALEQYDAVLRMDPQHWVARNNRAVVTMYSCRLAPALQDVESALAEAPWALLQVREDVCCDAGISIVTTGTAAAQHELYV